VSPAQSVWIDRSSTTHVLADPAKPRLPFIHPIVRIDYRQPRSVCLSDVAAAADFADNNWLAGVTQRHISRPQCRLLVANDTTNIASH